MIITYLGKQFFKVQQGDMVLAFNPISKDSKWSGLASRFGADIALSTVNYEDFNGVDMLSYGDKVPFTVTGPGDYEAKDVFIKGVLVWTEIKGKKYANTIYSVNLDDINLVFLGLVSSPKLPPEIYEELGSPDILFLPIGGGDVLSAADAYKVAVNFEPKVIIPMDYGEDREKNSLKTFLKEGGDDKTEALDKLTIKRKELEGKEGEIIVLNY